MPLLIAVTSHAPPEQLRCSPAQHLRQNYSRATVSAAGPAAAAAAVKLHTVISFT